MSRSSHKRVSVFVDVQNIYYTVKEKYNAHFDYTKFLSAVAKDRKLVKAFAYAIDKGDPKQINFQNILKEIGFEVKLKPFIQRSDGTSKGDWDIGITIDILDYAKLSDIVVLASGDGDFGILIDKIKKDHNVSVEVYGVQELTADSLIEKVTKFIPIKDDLLLAK